MNLWLRLLRVLITAFWRHRLRLTEPSALGFRVMPHDLDVNIHMNNARYLALMDLGRFDLIIRTGMLGAVVRNRWQPVIGGALVRYRRPLKPFQKFILRTRVLGWDDRWIYIEHRIEADGAPACLTMVRGAFLKNGAIVPPAEMARQAGFTDSPPPVPVWAGRWRELDGIFDEQPPFKVAREEMTCVR